MAHWVRWFAYENIRNMVFFLVATWWKQTHPLVPRAWTTGGPRTLGDSAKGSEARRRVTSQKPGLGDRGSGHPGHSGHLGLKALLTDTCGILGIWFIFGANPGFQGSARAAMGLSPLLGLCIRDMKRILGYDEDMTKSHWWWIRPLKKKSTVHSPGDSP